MIQKTMRSIVLAAAVTAASICPTQAAFVTVDNLSDVLVWAGTGSNQAGFVLQFGDSEDPTSITWGYRWDVNATMQDMMFAIAGNTTISGGSSPPPGIDGRLVVNGAQFDFGGGPVVFISSITYDQAGLPSEWFQGSRQIIDNFSNDGTYPTLYSNAGAGGSFDAPTMTFDAASVGISELALTDGGWYGFVQSTGPATFAFSQPVSAVAVPEPGTWALGAAAVVAALVLRRRSALAG